MSTTFKARVISDLVADIAILSFHDLEKLGTIILSDIVGEEFEHRGCTINGSPLGHTVDATDSAAHYVFQASIEQDYFRLPKKPKKDSTPTLSFKKIRNDCSEALSKHPQCKEIWLLSSQKKAPKAGTLVANLIDEFQTLNSRTLNVWDRQQIAELIFERLESERMVAKLGYFLPNLRRLADESSFSHHIPHNPAYVSCRREAVVLAAIAGQGVVTISGVSGMGKTSLASKVASDCGDKFDAVVWYDARELDNISQLTSVAVGRNQQHHNLVGLLAKRKVLLVLDDIKVDIFRELAPLAVQGSRILITTQSSSDPSRIEIAGLSQSAARRLLEAQVPCSDEQFDILWKKVGGFPLLLKVLCADAVEMGWDSMLDQLDSILPASEDESHQKVFQRILQRHLTSLSRELKFIRWAETTTYHPGILRWCISSKGQSNLAKRGFLSASSVGLVRLHDIVGAAVTAEVQVDPNDNSGFRQNLIDGISSEFVKDHELLEAVAHVHWKLFYRLQEQEPADAFGYMLALARPPGISLSAFGDPKGMALKLTSSTKAASSFELYAVIEAIEAGYTNRDFQGRGVEAKAWLDSQMDAFENLLSLPSLSKEMTRDIKHHRAKMKFRLGHNLAAQSEFEALLAHFPNFGPAMLQLARIYNVANAKPKAADLCLQIIERATEAPSHVSINVLIEAFVSLVDANSESIPDHQKLILGTLRRASLYDMSASRRLFAKVMSKFSYTHPEFVSELFHSIEWLDHLYSDDRSLFDWAQIQKHYGKAMGDDDQQSYRALLERALETYKSVKSRNSYHYVQQAEASILLERFAEATQTLREVPETKRNSFWHHRQAQSLLGLKKGKDALNEIDSAISKNKEDKYLPTFLWERAKILRTMEFPQAIEVMKQAGELVEPGKFQDQIYRTIKEWAIADEASMTIHES